MSAPGVDITLEGGLAPPAPCFYPTEEEFKDPFTYIGSIRPVAESYGICRIRPPKGWKPPYAVDQSTFRFRTRIQCIHELYNRGNGAANVEWRKSFSSFLSSTGRKWKMNPTICGSEIDLPTLHRAVQKRGGYQGVVDKRLWKEVARIVSVRRTSSLARLAPVLCPPQQVIGLLLMNFAPSCEQMSDLSTHAAYNLRQLYKEKLVPFDTWLADGAEGAKNIREDEEAAAALLGMAPAPPVSLPPKKRAKLEEKGGAIKTEVERVPENIDNLLCDSCMVNHHAEIDALLLV